MANFTKPAIRAAFRELLEERPINKITVKDIVERCGVNRNTFYYHYTDLPALLEELIRDSLNGILDEYPTLESTGDCANALLDYMVKNKRMIRHIYNSPNRDMYTTYLRGAASDIIDRHFSTMSQKYDLGPEDTKALNFCIRCLYIGMLDTWLADGMKDETTALARRMNEMVSQTLEFALKHRGEIL